MHFADHNSPIPRGELGGRTPDEAYRERELGFDERLREQHADARVRRIEANRARTCEPTEHAPPTPPLALVP